MNPLWPLHGSCGPSVQNSGKNTVASFLDDVFGDKLMVLTPTNLSGTLLDQQTNYFGGYVPTCNLRTLHQVYGIASRLLLLKLSLILYFLNVFLINIVL